MRCSRPSRTSGSRSPALRRRQRKPQPRRRRLGAPRVSSVVAAKTIGVALDVLCNADSVLCAISGFGEERLGHWERIALVELYLVPVGVGEFRLACGVELRDLLRRELPI